GAFEVSMACFERRRAELDATLSALARVEGGAVSEAWRAIPSPSVLRPCRDAEQLAAWAEHPPSSREAAADLAYVRTLEVIGELELAQARLAELTARAERDHDEGTQLQARLQRTRALFDAGDLEGGLADAEAVYFDARRQGQHEVEREAAFLLGGYSLGHGDRGAARVWLRMLEDLQGPDRIFGRRVWLEARLLEEEGKSEAAVQLLSSALDRLDEDEVDHRLLLLDGLNTAYDAAGRPGLALEVIDDAIALARSVAGDYSSTVSPLLSNRGLVLSQLERHDEAIASHREAIALQEALVGPDEVDASGARLNLALALLMDEQPDAALEMLPAIIEATERRLGDEHPDVALVLEVRGEALRTVGQAEESLEDFARALAIARKRYGPTNPEVAQYLAQQARSLRALGRRQAELETAMASLGVYEAIGQADHPRARLVRLEAAQASLALGHLEDAMTLAERTWGEQDAPEHRRNVADFVRELGRRPELAARAAAMLETVAAG
ncbi:MAG: tetratricopeptide repeat protein, partial [Nannocystaceae bacterium]